MVQVLIPTHPEDFHALAVAHVLRSKAHHPTLWYGADFPSRQHASIDILPEGRASWEINGPALKLDNAPFDVVWYRHASFVQSTSGVQIEKAKLPEEIDQSCRILMDRLGIVFGCFDFLVTPQNEYIFPEVNEMGQFLWIEELNPEILLLQPFADFIVGRDSRFSWKPSRGMYRWGDLKQDIISGHLHDEVTLHLAKPNYFAVRDHVA